MSEGKFLVVNPGSTSTKIAIFDKKAIVYEKILRHSPEELSVYPRVVDQFSFRKSLILAALQEDQADLSTLTCVVGRGGVTKPLAGGTYRINERMCEELRNTNQGHASNLGALVAKAIADERGLPAFIVDPVVVDEMEPIAKLTGFKGVTRKSIFHALNQKAVARKAAAQLQKEYQDCRFIIAHLGGGISVGVHQNGRVIDVNNALDGDGPFAPERAGSIPTGLLVEICYNGGFTQKEMYRKLAGRGGLVGLLGTNDARTVEKMIAAGDDNAKLVYEAMAYQIAKEIGSCSAVLFGKVDRIILTGGLAHSRMLTQWIKDRVEFIAPILVFPGEGEMEALAQGAWRIMEGADPVREYV